MEKTVLITGTSSGIGRTAVKHFQKKGWQVVATMRTPEKEHELSKLEKVACIRLDVTDTQSIQEALREALDRFQTIDAVVNNAGYGLLGPFELTTQEQIQKQFDTNVFGVMKVTREILPHFRERGQGLVINVASMAGRIAFPLFSLYHASKWAIEGFTESLQYELRPFNIKVKLIEPGLVKTDFDGRSKEEAAIQYISDYDSYVERTMKKIMASYKFGTTPEKVAQVIYKATTDNNHRLRYPIGLDADALLFIRRLLPDHFFDGMIRQTMGR
ncbi:SDR family oxidoreductase [Deltaproteobacteria bacterium TL4]